MLKILNKHEKEDAQKRGYMCEHLLCLYSMVSDRTALYNDTFPVFLNSFGETDVILFGLDKKGEDQLTCIRELMKLPMNTLNIVSPTAFNGVPGVKTKYVDWDFHINVAEFDLNLGGRRYKPLRYRIQQAEKKGYHTRLARNFTSKHTYILSRHMARYNLDVWDYEELLSLDRFFREHEHGLMMEAYQNEKLVGFDVLDFFDANKILAVPLGIYLDSHLVSDFLMYENLKYARDRGYVWLDVGPTCGSVGVKRFKEKWHAKPKFQIFVQALDTTSKK